jgi:bacterioferritin-associated ferredoxin
MNPEDPVCLCFHVSRRKVINFIRIEKPRRPSQLSECFGAGTGCGWCRLYLEKLLHAEISRNKSNGQDPADSDMALDEMSSSEYARMRSKYVRRGGGTPPPGATPLEPESK